MFRLLFFSWLLTLPLQQPETAPSLRQAQALFEQRQFAAAARLACPNPNNLAAWKLCGLALQLSQQIPPAEQTFQRAVAAFPQDAELWFYLARVQYLQAQLKASEAAAQQAIQVRAGFADAHTQLAMTLDALHDDAAALQHYETAIQLNQKQ